MLKKHGIVIIASILFSGCASEPTQNYAEQIASMPVPVNENERQQKCSWLRSEMARQQNIAAYGATQLQGTFALIAQMQARNNTATLESRASDFGCYAAFSGSRPAPSNIESCVSMCKANTTRTSEQCFDSCNH